MTTLNFKTGGTIKFEITLKNNDGALITGASSQLKSEMRNDRGDLGAEFTISEKENAEGTYVFTKTGANNFEVGEYFCDVRYNDGMYITFSKTFAINMEKGITQ